MDNHEKKVVAIVPAYNEAERIGEVLRVLQSYAKFDEILVVDDGSTDGTAEAAEALGIRVIRSEKNLGKGRAMQIAAEATDAPVLFFSDADIRGLSLEIIEHIVDPVRTGKVDMFIGMRNRKIYFAQFIFTFIPLLGGERACTRELWHKIPLEFKDGFQIESALNFFASRDGRSYDFKVFPGLSQTIKEKKYGLWRGFSWRVSMFSEIISTNFKLYFSSWNVAFRRILDNE